MATSAAATEDTDTVFQDDSLGQLYNDALLVMKRIRQLALDPETGQKVGPTFQISKAANLVGRTASAIREAEKDGRLPPRDRTENGRRVQYSLKDLDHMREVFGTRPWRDPSDPTAIISISNFKGGVGKSTTAMHLAQYCAIRGYRTLLVDCDSQATSTMMFGYVPDYDFKEEDTLYGYIHEPPLGGLGAIARETHFHNLKLVPANLKLYNLEYEIAGYIMKNGNFDIIDTISLALETVVDDYDIIIMDPPPALGMVSLGVLSAANALVIPMPPSIVDFSSTASFIDMLNTTMKQLEGLRSTRPVYNFVKVLASKVDDNNAQVQRQILDITSKVFGPSMLSSMMKKSAEIDNASARMKTVYELDGPVTSYSVHNRCVDQLDAANHDILAEVVKTWPSKAKGL